jgi:hypothetical protein
MSNSEDLASAATADSAEPSTTVFTSPGGGALRRPSFSPAGKKTGSSALVAMLKMKQTQIEVTSPSTATIAGEGDDAAPTVTMSPVVAMLKQKQAAREGGEATVSSTSFAVSDKVAKSNVLAEIKSTISSPPKWTEAAKPVSPQPNKAALLGAIKNTKCPKCEKSVYKAEEVVAIGRSWHKTCFACGGSGTLGCGRVLQINNFKPDGGLPYCSACFTKNFTYLAAKSEGSESGGGVSA